MRKLLSFTLILALVLSSVSFAFAEPDTWAFGSNETGKLQAYDESQNKWQNSNIKGYKELEYVPMRYISDDKSTMTYAIEFDYYENGDSSRYGFDDVKSTVDFYNGSGTKIPMTGKYTVDLDKSENSGLMVFTITITNASGLPAEFAMNFEARLAGPGQSSQWSGASLHARLVADGNKEVSIDTPPYGTLEVTKEFTGEERPDSGEVVIQFSGDYDYEITLNVGNSWHGVIPNVEPGEYLVSEEYLGENWAVSYNPETVTVNEKDTFIVTVTNTFNPPVTTTGSITFVKEWEGDFVPESGYVTFTVNGEYPFARVEYPSWTTTVEDLTLGTYNLTKEWVFETGDQTYYNVSGIPQTVELTETTPDATFTVANHMNPPTGDVMFHKYFEFVDPGDYPASVTVDWEGTPVEITSAGGWTVTVPDMPVGMYFTTEEEIGQYWSEEIKYYVGSLDGVTPGAYISVGDGDDIPVEEGKTTHVFVYNTYDEPSQEEYGKVEVQKLFEGIEELEGFGDMEFRIQFTLRFPDGETVNTITDTYTGSEWLATPRYFNGIPAGSGYMVEETIFEMTTPVSGYWTESVTPTSFEVLGGQTAHVDVTNTYSSEPTYGVAIEKTVNPTSHYTGGGPVSYTITFENIGNTATYDWVDFDDLLDEGMTTGDMFNTEAWIDGVFITGDGGEIFGAPMPMTSYGGFEPGDVITITYDYDSSGLGIGTYNNTITGCAWMGGIEEPDDDFTPEMSRDIGPAVSQPICDTDTASFDVDRRPVTRDDDPGVRIEKTVDVEEASVGDTVTYTIKVTNNGDVSLFDVEVLDGAIGVTWEIGDLGKDDSITEEFEYEIKETDFVDGVFENIAEVTADSREGKASDTDDAVVEEETIDVPPVTPPETPPEIVVPPEIPPQALPQTGQAGMGFIYSIGSVMLLAGAGFGRKKRK